MGCQARRVAEWQGCGYHRDMSLRLQVSTIIKSKDSTYLFYCHYVLAGMESSTDTFDYKSWARNIPLYKKISQMPSPAPLQISSPSSLQVSSTASHSQGTRPVKQEASTSSSTPEEPQQTKWWRLSAVLDSFTSFFSRPASSEPEESQQRKWQGFSAVQDLFASFFPRSTSSPQRAESQRRKWPRLLAFKESVASFFLRPTIETVLFLFALIFLLVAAIVFRSGTQTHLRTLDPHSSDADCLRMISSASSLESFPLPYQVDLKAHEVIININSLPDLEMLTLLNHTHSAVCSILASTAQALVRYVANASEIYLPLPNGYEIDSFSTDTLSISQQLRVAASQVNSLAERYEALQKDYEILMKEISEGSKEHELSAIPGFLVWAQPGGAVQQLGFFNAHEAFLGPVEARVTVMGKVLSGVVALTRERQRVVKIKSVVGEVDRVLQLLIEAVWDSRASSLKTKAGRDVIRRRVKEWYTKHIIQNSRLKEDWMELLTSVNLEEKKEGRALKMNITREWCYASRSTRHKSITIA